MTIVPITREQIIHVFEPFFKMDPPTLTPDGWCHHATYDFMFKGHVMAWADATGVKLPHWYLNKAPQVAQDFFTDSKYVAASEAIEFYHMVFFNLDLTLGDSFWHWNGHKLTFRSKTDAVAFKLKFLSDAPAADDEECLAPLYERTATEMMRVV